ncbi:MAG: GFA family protein [Mesorhizobium sp.]|uniref:GFA family protein n=1 Tax=Mesorhizobium sp. TaxID=1871066 RepID=UPI001AD11E5D|nr:GFA family protein [Mesorhizobium sp.]MBN9217287.1 GFA family protein [Mesorhizobium sp.]
MLKGKCHCGQVQYEVSAIEGGLWHCHCRTCRKTHAAQRNTAARVNRENFQLTAGADRLTSYQSMPGKFRHFCSGCGSHIYAEYPDRPFVVLRAATLDDDPGVRVTMNVWMSHDLPWLADDPTVPRYQEGPPPAP